MTPPAAQPVEDVAYQSAHPAGRVDAWFCIRCLHLPEAMGTAGAGRLIWRGISARVTSWSKDPEA